MLSVASTGKTSALIIVQIERFSMTDNTLKQQVKAAIFATPDEHLQSRDILIHNICAALAGNGDVVAYEMVHDTGPDRGLSWKPDNPLFGKGWTALPLGRLDAAPVQPAGKVEE